MIGDNKLQKLQLMCHEMEKYNKNISKITQNTTLQKNKLTKYYSTWNKRHFFKNIVLIIITFFYF